jgi:HSP20 family protein
MLVRRGRPVKPRLASKLAAFDPVRRELLRSFSGLFPAGTESSPGESTRGAMGAEIFPHMDITQDAENLYLHAELTGVDPEQLSISAFRNSVSLTGKRSLSGADDWQGRGECAFDCTVALPAEVDAERMDARYCNGVLALMLPKAQTGDPRLS